MKPLSPWIACASLGSFIPPSMLGYAYSTRLAGRCRKIVTLTCEVQP